MRLNTLLPYAYEDFFCACQQSRDSQFSSILQGNQWARVSGMAPVQVCIILCGYGYHTCTCAHTCLKHVPVWVTRSQVIPHGNTTDTPPGTWHGTHTCIHSKSIPAPNPDEAECSLRGDIQDAKGSMKLMNLRSEQSKNC